MATTKHVGPHRAHAPAVRVGLVGCGTVGGEVARALAAGTYESLRLVRVCGRAGSRPRPGWLGADVEWTTRFEDLLAGDVDVLVELVGGLSPAREWARATLLAGKSVVTANKQLVAEEGAGLLALAARQRRHFRFGASVAGGVPVLEAIGHGLAGDRLTAITGVVNGTCNYVLTRMEEARVPFDEALREAQAAGFAEADPRNDIDGADARAKLAILCRVGFGQSVPPSQIACRSIAGITPADFTDAAAQGTTIRQVARAVREGGGRVEASVGPEHIPADSPLARARGPENVVIVTGERGGDTVYAGRGAGGAATAVAVLSDLLSIAAARGQASVAPASGNEGRRRTNA